MLNNNILLNIVIALCLFNLCLSFDHFRFSRDIDCTNQDKNGHCQDWSQTTTLYRYSSSIYYCFPGDSWVLTRNGPVQMMDLSLNDQIFGMNLETAKNEFSQVTAWMHRDSSSLLQYSLIEVQNSSWNFIGSDYHNIAYSNQNSTDFKFLKDLDKNDTLISLTNTGEHFKVKSVKKQIEKEGLYSPLTQTGTYYVYPDNFNNEEFESKNEQYPMILVHCLSQIKDPIKNFQIASTYVKLSQYIFNPHEPTEDQEYVNPLIQKFSIVFGNDWVEIEGQKIAHKYTSSSYSSTRNRQEQERKRKTMAVIALQTVLSNTLL